MKKVKYIFWLIIIAFIVAVIYQNQEYFLTEQSIYIDIWITEAYQSPELMNVILYLIVFVAALIIGYLFSLAIRFRANQTIKAMRREMESQIEIIAGMQRELDTYKPQAPPAPVLETPVEQPTPTTPTYTESPDIGNAPADEIATEQMEDDNQQMADDAIDKTDKTDDR